MCIIIMLYTWFLITISTLVTALWSRTWNHLDVSVSVLELVDGERPGPGRHAMVDRRLQLLELLFHAAGLTG